MNSPRPKVTGECALCHHATDDHANSEGLNWPPCLSCEKRGYGGCIDRKEKVVDAVTD